MTRHPIYGDMVVRNPHFPASRWMVRNANVFLDDVLHLIENGWNTDEILKRHILLLRADLLEITMIHTMQKMRRC